MTFQGETKGKEVDFNTLLKTNPALNPDTKPRMSNIDLIQQKLDSVRRETMITSNGRLPQPKVVKPVSNGSSNVTPIDPDVTFVSSIKDMTLPTAPRRTQTAEYSKKLNMKENDVPLASIKEDISAVMIPSPPKQTYEKIKELENKREERRAKQSEMKRQKLTPKEMENNPHWQFLQMINEYRSQVDYRPLSSTDSVIDNKISVCVRKRPVDKKELSRKEIDVVTVPNKDHIVVHQPQVKVDLTKYIENQKFRFDYTFDEDSDNEMVYR